MENGPGAMSMQQWVMGVVQRGWSNGQWAWGNGHGAMRKWVWCNEHGAMGNGRGVMSMEQWVMSIA